MAYHRKNHALNSRLAVRRDELKAAIVTRDEQGRVILSALPALIFPDQATAEQFGLLIIKYGNKPEGKR